MRSFSPAHSRALAGCTNSAAGRFAWFLVKTSNSTVTDLCKTRADLQRTACFETGTKQSRFFVSEIKSSVLVPLLLYLSVSDLYSLSANANSEQNNNNNSFCWNYSSGLLSHGYPCQIFFQTFRSLMWRSSSFLEFSPYLRSLTWVGYRSWGQNILQEWPRTARNPSKREQQFLLIIINYKILFMFADCYMCSC